MSTSSSQSTLLLKATASTSETTKPSHSSQEKRKPSNQTQTQLSVSPQKLKVTPKKRKADIGWDNAEGFGAYMRHKNRKLREQFSEQYTTLSDFLSGVVVWVDGYTKPSRMEIKQLLGQHGGKFETYYGSTVTHIIAETLATATRKRLSEMKRATFKVVRPQWLVDSIENGKRMDEGLYSVKGMTDPLQRTVAGFFKSPKPKRKIKK